MLKPNIEVNGKTILITGAIGFIGYHLVFELLKSFNNINIIGLDNVNDYYDVNLKKYRLLKINERANKNWTFIKGDIVNKEFINDIFDKYKPSIVIHLAAQAGVRYSITNPDVYINTNLIGFFNMLEGCRNNNVEHFVYASSSSVYGANNKIPYSTDDKTDTPVSLYAATKKANELLMHSYSKLYNIPSTGLRFFTVYGPAGRPDMFYYDYVNKVLNNQKVKVFNYGDCMRDFTYVDDVVEGIKHIMQCAPIKKEGIDGLPIPPTKLYNIGKGHPEKLLDLITIIENKLISYNIVPNDYDFESLKEYVPMQSGDVVITYADTTDLVKDFNFKPSVTLDKGIDRFIKWYKQFYNL